MDYSILSSNCFLDSSKGYIKDNIQLVTWKVNCLKQHFDNSEFIELCKQVAKKKLPHKQ